MSKQDDATKADKRPLKAAPVAAESAVSEEFPIGIGEFCSGLTRAESRLSLAFRREIEAGGHRYGESKAPSEWRKLYDHWRKKPTAITWLDWSRRLS